MGGLDLGAWTETIGDFQLRHWPTRVSPDARINKVIEELGEVAGAHHKSLGHDKIRKEMGDLFITVLGLAFVLRVDLEAELIRVHAMNIERFGP